MERCLQINVHDACDSESKVLQHLVAAFIYNFRLLSAIIKLLTSSLVWCQYDLNDNYFVVTLYNVSPLKFLTGEGILQ